MLSARRKLRAKLNGRQDRQAAAVKLGLDPLAPDIHLGHTVVIRKTQSVSGLGHTVDLPDSAILRAHRRPVRGKNVPRTGTRSSDEIAPTQRRTSGKFSSCAIPKRTGCVFNGEWMDKSPPAYFVKLCGQTTAKILDVPILPSECRRKPISFTNCFIPCRATTASLLEAASVELGGTDQIYNLRWAATCTRFRPGIRRSSSHAAARSPRRLCQKFRKSLVIISVSTRSAEEMFCKSCRARTTGMWK